MWPFSFNKHSTLQLCSRPNQILASVKGIKLRRWHAGLETHVATAVTVNLYVNFCGPNPEMLVLCLRHLSHAVAAVSNSLYSSPDKVDRQSGMTCQTNKDDSSKIEQLSYFISHHRSMMCSPANKQ